MPWKVDLWQRSPGAVISVTGTSPLVGVITGCCVAARRGSASPGRERVFRANAASQPPGLLAWWKTCRACACLVPALPGGICCVVPACVSHPRIRGRPPGSNIFDPADHACARGRHHLRTEDQPAVRAGFWPHGSTAAPHDGCRGIRGCGRNRWLPRVQRDRNHNPECFLVPQPAPGFLEN